MSNLTQTTITFGKYKNKDLSVMLKDRNYCSWLLEQDWFLKNYEYLHNRIKEYCPKKIFVPETKIDNSTIENLIETYPYFHLTPVSDLNITLSENEKICYKYYNKLLKSIKEKLTDNLQENQYDIKAPSGWLNKFEIKYGIPRSEFKEFLQSYDLPNITLVVEEIKKFGGIEYKGNKSFKIAKENSLKQEKYWENILKKYYLEDIGTQFKFENCFFDFIHIKKNILFECKLGLKDFNEEQYKKYISTLKNYNIIYLIDRDCIIDFKNNKLYTTDKEKYLFVITQNSIKNTMFLKMFKTLDITEIQDTESFFKN
jgi:hypothetical protein